MVIVCLGVLLVAVLVITGKIQILVVLSSSMQPTFTAGDVIITVDTPVSLLKTNDIITYHSPDNTNQLVTHRIVHTINTNTGLAFQTKGDANEQPDRDMVSADKVVGRMVVSIPYVGAVAQVSRSSVGYVLLVLIPGIFVISAEVYSIVKKEKRKQEQITQ